MAQQEKCKKKKPRKAFVDAEDFEKARAEWQQERKVVFGGWRSWGFAGGGASLNQRAALRPAEYCAVWVGAAGGMWTVPQRTPRVTYSPPAVSSRRARVLKQSAAAGWPAKCHFAPIWVYRG